VDPSEHFFGLRLNMYVAIVLTVVGVRLVHLPQRRGKPAAELRPGARIARRTARRDGGGQRRDGGVRPGRFRPPGGFQSRRLQRGCARQRHGLTVTRTGPKFNSINNETRARHSN
jgi:hypothetical protein